MVHMDTEHLRARRIDIVDGNGVRRATLSASDDHNGERIAPFAGLIIRDSTGKERGGIGVIDVPDENRVAWVLDHPGGDAVGTMVTDSGETLWVAHDRDADGKPGNRRIQMRVAADGTPSIGLHDSEGRTRLRLTLTEEGAGAIQFVRADGSVAEQIVPEHLDGSTR